MQLTDTPPEGELALGGIEALAEPKRAEFWMRPVEIAAAGLLVVMIVTVLANVFFRYVLTKPLIWGDEVASISFIWMAMLGAALAVDRHEHMRLTVFLPLLPERLARVAEVAGQVLVCVLLLRLLPVAVEYAYEESFVRSPALGLPMSWRASALPAGIGLMAVLAVLSVLRSREWRIIAATLAITALAVALMWFARPALLSIGNWNLPIWLGLLVAVLLCIGVPIAFCFALGTLAYLTFASHAPIFVMMGRIDEGMSSLILLSVPVFVLLGCILDATGMGKAIVNFLASLLGHVKAGMSYVLLGSMFLVSGISGSKVSDMATVAPALFPEMRRRGHSAPEMTALLATGAAMADTVPPSIVLIVLGSVAGVSIAGLFTSGFVIAMVLLVVLAVLARWKARAEDMSGVRAATLPLIGRTALIAAPALVLPFMIRSLVGGGVATATEVSTIAVVYAFVIGVVLYGGIPLRKLGTMLVETAAMSGAILLILGAASAMAWALTQSGFARDLMAVVTGLPGGWVVFMLASILIFLILGCVLEGLPAIVLLAPIMFPIARGLGIHDIHYAMVIVTAMNIGLMAPPIGIGFYIACKIANVPADQVMRRIWPYLAALLVGLLAIAAVPWFSTALL
ncbi:tripartite ATP-independent transporter DctM subunit [Paracoccus pantotrophus]|uniref:TRAP transporter large permease subunit n=1 Tax=Paracoccus pantotrophus TaxID=82367 RepID=A0AAE6NUM8_PARPN|nr:TRAP transporter large permease subunit [Paracoccus pantotrophus]MDF3854226.1 TRAP transporter large permease subunit [Paracoccus pantotrophus]QFG36505.1 TRAP transporter large permease subunit [Paracoccus pantotrophus]RKS42903.1 tripartite ATP-independent transporter DctM subunit [Paracoccus pantotrophus]SFO27592.1 TRAP transporter, DctM subunit [Paracoccus pantotrophus]